MGKKEQLEAALVPHLEEHLTSGRMDGLLGFMKIDSNLPGPRANLELADVFAKVVARDAECRGDPLWALRKALGCTLSLVGVELPERGFELMDGLIRSQDQDLIWIAKNNLKKKRLLNWFPDEVQARSRVE